MMAVLKVRASMHSTELRLFHIDDDGIKIDQMLTNYEGLLGSSPTRSQPGSRQRSGPDDG